MIQTKSVQGQIEAQKLELEWKKGICGIYPAGCWVEVGLKDNKLVNIKQDTSHPLGMICRRIIFMFLLSIIFTTILEVSLTSIIQIASPIAFGILLIINLLLITTSLLSLIFNVSRLVTLTVPESSLSTFILTPPMVSSISFNSFKSSSL